MKTLRIFISTLALLLGASIALACGGSGDAAGAGDGDGDAAAGDGDATIGDGDAATGDGDAATGDGDGATGDGDALVGDGDDAGGPGTGGGGTVPSCSRPDDEVGTFNSTIEIAGEERVYRVVVPDGYTGTEEIPVVFILHGVGVTIQATHDYFGQHVVNAVGDAGISVYLEAAASNNRAWMSASLAPSIENVDVRYFDEVLEVLLAKYCIDPERVFVTGFSNGARMTNRLRCDRANVIRAVGPVAGAEAGSDCPAVPAFVTHATNDGAVPFFGGEGTRDALIESNGCSDSTSPLEVDGCLSGNNCSCVEYDDCPDGRLQWCEHEQDHHYDAWHARAIWQFFSEF